MNDVHAEVVNRIGNLTLLQGTKNSAGSNSPLPVKVAGAYQGTEIRLTLNTNVDALWDHENGKWDPAGIDARQAELAKYAASAWSL